MLRIATILTIFISFLQNGCLNDDNVESVDSGPDEYRMGWYEVTVGDSIEGPAEILEQSLNRYNLEIEAELHNPYQMTAIPMAPEPIWATEPPDLGIFNRGNFLVGEVEDDTEAVITVTIDDEIRSMDIMIKNQSDITGWCRTWTNAPDKVMSNVVVDKDGIIYIASALKGPADLDPGPEIFELDPGGDVTVYAAGNVDPLSRVAQEYIGYVSKFDAQGNFLDAFRISYGSAWTYGAGEATLTMVIDNSGNLVIAGVQDLSKYDRDGNRLFNHVFPSAVFKCDPLALAIGPNDEIYIGGRIASVKADLDLGDGEYFVGSGEEEHVTSFICNYTRDGELDWVREWKETGPPYHNRVHEIAADKSGNIFVVGMFGGVNSFDLDPGSGYKAAIDPGNTNIFLCHLDSDGYFVWGKNWPGCYPRIAADYNGNVYVSCSTSYYLSTNMDALLKKFNSDGDEVWSHQWGGSEREYIYRLCTDGGGNVYLSGRFNGSIDFDPGPGTFEITHDSTSIFVESLTPEGNFRWARTWEDLDWYGCPVGLGVSDDGWSYLMGAFNRPLDIDPGPGVYTQVRENWSDRYYYSDWNNNFFLLGLDRNGNFRNGNPTP